MKTTGLYFSCKVGALPEDFFSVTEFTLEEGLADLFTLTLEVSSQLALPAKLKSLLLEQVTFTVETDGIHRRTVTGYIESAEYTGTNVHRTAYRLVVRPKLWLLTLEQTSRIFHFKSLPEILFFLLDEHGVEYDSRFYDQHEQREYITQKRESNYEFFIRLVAEEGIIFWYEGKKLFLSDRPNGMLLLDKKIEYNPHIQPGHKERVVHDMRYTATMRPTEMAIKDYLYVHSRVNMLYKAESKPSDKLAKFQYYDSYGRFPSENVGKQYSRYRLESLRADSELGRGKSNVIELRPGYHFDVLGHPNEEMHRRWQIVGVRHHGKLPQSLGKESGSKAATLTNEFSFISSDQHWRLAYRYKPLADGDEVATVVGPQGEEIYVNKEGCVRIHFHWNLGDKADENASCWVRVAQGWNGSLYGLMAIPRIGQEVVISYLNGDIDRPLITGTTYNGHNNPPLRLPAEKTQLVLRTKTHKGEGYNELRFEDEKEKQEIYVHAQKDMRVLVKNDVHRHTQHDERVRVENNHYVQIEGEDHLTVAGMAKHHVKGDIYQNTDSNLHLQQKDSLLVNSGQQIHLTSGSKFIIDAGAEISLNVGGSYIRITPGGIFTSDLNVGAGSAGSGSGVTMQLPQGIKALKSTTFNLQSTTLTLVPVNELQGEPFNAGPVCALQAEQEGGLLIMENKRGQ